MRAKPGAGALLRRQITGTEGDMNAATEPIPQADLTAEVWTITHIAAYFQLRQSAAYDKAREPGFPAPLGQAGRCRRWLASAVREHVKEPPKAAPVPAYSSPSSAGTLRRRKVAA